MITSAEKYKNVLEYVEVFESNDIKLKKKNMIQICVSRPDTV